MTDRFTRLILTGCLLVSAVGASNTSAQNQDADRSNVDSTGLVVEAMAGWDGVVDRAKPVPIALMLNNYSERVIEGQLFLNDPVNGHEVPLGDVLISPGSSRRLTTIQAVPDWFECVATLRSEEKILWRRALPIITGKEFNRGTNFILFVSEGGRELPLINAAADPEEIIALANSEKLVAGRNGRAVECLTVKPWQVPNHPGPMVAARAMVFPEDSSAAALNKVQWRAIAEWMCQGGTVFVHKGCSEIVEQLVAASPLTAGPSTFENTYSIRRVGLGSIYEFDEPLFATKSDAMRDRITQTTAHLSSNHIVGTARSTNTYVRDAGQSEINQLWVVLFFGCYTLLCGVAILLFRKSRRAIATYIVSVVLITSVLSAVLGAMLRASQGDMRWTTVTQAGSGGVVQVGKLEVQSSGGRSTTVALYGSNVDLLVVEDVNRNYYSWNEERGFPPFRWQPRLVNDGDRRAVDVPIRPWGQRELHATAFGPDTSAIDFELEFEPSTSTQSKNAGRMPTGTFSVKLTNTLDVELSEVWLVIGVTGKLDANLIATNSQRRRWRSNAVVVPPDAGHQLTDLYQTHSLTPHPGRAQTTNAITVGKTHKSNFAADFNFDMRGHYGDGHRCNFINHSSLPLPRISHLGTASAWIIATIPESPVLNIDSEKNDFFTHKGTHFFVQEINPDKMPAPTLFYDAVDD